MLRTVVIFIALFIGHISALTLPPATLAAPIKIDTTFTLTKTDNAKTVIAKLTQNKEVSTFDSNSLNKIAQEILLTATVNVNSFQTVKWDLTITPQVGTLKVVSLRADTKNLSVHFYGSLIQVTQSIPPVYNSQQVCSNSGHRKYGVAGPRSRKCHTVTTPRGLTPAEVQQVANALLAQIPVATAKLAATK